MLLSRLLVPSDPCPFQHVTWQLPLRREEHPGHAMHLLAAHCRQELKASASCVDVTGMVAGGCDDGTFPYGVELM